MKDFLNEAARGSRGWQWLVPSIVACAGLAGNSGKTELKFELDSKFKP